MDNLLSFLVDIVSRRAMFNHGAYRNTTSAAPCVAEEAPKSHGCEKQTVASLGIAGSIPNEGLFLTGLTTSREGYDGEYLHRSLKVTYCFEQLSLRYALPFKGWADVPRFDRIYPVVADIDIPKVLGMVKTWRILDALVSKGIAAQKRAAKKDEPKVPKEPKAPSEKVKVSQAYKAYEVLLGTSKSLPRGFWVEGRLSNVVTKRDSVLSRIKALAPECFVFGDAKKNIRVVELSLFETAIKSGFINLSESSLTSIVNELAEVPQWVNSLSMSIKTQAEYWLPENLDRLPESAVQISDKEFMIPVRSLADIEETVEV